MTCDELKEQETELKQQIDVLNATVASNKSNANLDFVVCLAADTYGGTYPPPLNMANSMTTSASQVSIMLRINYLMALNPKPMAVINQYMNLYNVLQTIYTAQVTLDQKNAQLQSILQQEIEQGC